MRTYGCVGYGSLLGPVDPSFRALSGRLEFTVRRHKFNKDSLRYGLPLSSELGTVKTVKARFWPWISASSP